MAEKQGVIYILTNPSFRDYVKIGYADDVERRLQQLNRSECIPFAFRIYATYEVDSRLSDLKIHSIIDKLNPNLRSIDNFNGQKRVREFYAMSPEDAYSILEAIAEIHGCTDRLKRFPLSETDARAEETAEDIEEQRKERLAPFPSRAAASRWEPRLNTAIVPMKNRGLFAQLWMTTAWNMMGRSGPCLRWQER